MAALRWAALNLWSSHDTARDDPPAASPATTDDETSASESDDSVTRSLPPLETSTTLDGAAFRPPTEPNVDDAAGAWDLHDEPECPVCLEPWAVDEGSSICARCLRHICPRLCGNQISGRPTPSTRCCLRSCICSMAWQFHAIGATFSSRPCRLDGVGAHEGPRCAPRLDGRCPLCRGLFPDAAERMTLLENHVAAGRRPALCGNQPFGRMREAPRKFDFYTGLAMTCLGECYLYGHVGCPQDAAKALPLLQQAAELGESDALAYLGAAFMEGWAVARDEAKAVEYLRLAARRDHADALNDLAAALASGTGTTVDKAQAAALFQRAAERGHSRAAANLANLTNPQ